MTHFTWLGCLIGFLYYRRLCHKKIKMLEEEARSERQKGWYFAALAKTHYDALEKQRREYREAWLIKIRSSLKEGPS